jgi:hypothetical protein
MNCPNFMYVLPSLSNKRRRKKGSFSSSCCAFSWSGLPGCINKTSTRQPVPMFPANFEQMAEWRTSAHWHGLRHHTKGKPKSKLPEIAWSVNLISQTTPMGVIFVCLGCHCPQCCFLPARPDFPSRAGYPAGITKEESIPKLR